MTGRNLPEVIVVAGPTASGKTAAAVELAGRLGADIISADSMQVYRHLSIGTAKPTAEELRGVTCHLVDCVDPDYQYNLGDYVRDASALVERFRAQGRPAIVAGGTGLYIKGLLYGVFEGETRDPAIRAELARRADAGELGVMHKELLSVDPDAAFIQPGDRQRILRALEVFRVTGLPITRLQTQHAAAPRYRTRLFVLSVPRPELHRRIEDRCRVMVGRGLLAEVRGYLERGFSQDNPAIRALGYAELIAHIRGDLSLKEAMAAMIRKTRQYAKRQETWFRGMRLAEWIPAGDASALEVSRRINGHLSGNANP